MVIQLHHKEIKSKEVMENVEFVFLLLTLLHVYETWLLTLTVLSLSLPLSVSVSICICEAAETKYRAATNSDDESVNENFCLNGT